MMLKISFFSFVLILLNVAAQEHSQVLDIYGNPVVPGEQYYIRRGITFPGGTGLLPKPETLCFPNVILMPSELQDGLPVQFTPVNQTSVSLYANSTDVYIHFPGVKTCNNGGSFWLPRRFVQRAPIYIVAGTLDEPSTWDRFRVMQFGSGYELASCPTGDACKPIGFVSENGGYRLVVKEKADDIPLGVVFIRKHAAEAISAI